MSVKKSETTETPQTSNKEDEFVNLSLAKPIATAQNEVEKVAENIQYTENEIKENMENKKEEIRQEVGEIKAEAVTKIEGAEAEASSKIEDFKKEVNEKKENIGEELRENKENLTQEAHKLQEGMKDNKDKLNSKIGAVSETASAATAAMAQAGSEKPISTVNNKELALYAHNFVRKLHGVSPMKWDDKLGEASQKWAVHLAKTDAGLQHSDPLDGFGENLYISKGSAAATGAHQAVLQWYKTATHYNFNDPRFNLSSGTFTQLVWDDSVKLGVGIAFREDTRHTYIVAQYAPPGNGRYSESFKQHVKKPLAGLPARIPKLEELVPPSDDQPEEKLSNMKSLFDVLCHWCVSKEEKPVESWSGVQSNKEENTVEANTTNETTNPTATSSDNNTNTNELKTDNKSEATKT